MFTTMALAAMTVMTFMMPATSEARIAPGGRMGMPGVDQLFEMRGATHARKALPLALASVTFAAEATMFAYNEMVKNWDEHTKTVIPVVQNHSLNNIQFPSKGAVPRKGKRCTQNSAITVST